MYLQDLGGHTERENGLVQVDGRVVVVRRRGRECIAGLDLHCFQGWAGCVVYAIESLTLGDRGDCRLGAILKATNATGKEVLLRSAAISPNNGLPGGFLLP